MAITLQRTVFSDIDYLIVGTGSSSIKVSGTLPIIGEITVSQIEELNRIITRMARQSLTDSI